MLRSTVSALGGFEFFLKRGEGAKRYKGGGPPPHHLNPYMRTACPFHSRRNLLRVFLHERDLSHCIAIRCETIKCFFSKIDIMHI